MHGIRVEKVELTQGMDGSINYDFGSLNFSVYQRRIIIIPFDWEASLVTQMVKESACNTGDLGLIPGLGRSHGEGNGNPLQYSCLLNPID